MDLWTQGGGEERMEKVAFTKHCKNLKNKQKINLKRSQWSEVAKSIVGDSLCVSALPLSSSVTLVCFFPLQIEDSNIYLME